MAADVTTVLKRSLAAAVARGDLDEAEALLARLREEDPLSVETRGLELEFLVRRGRTREAGELARRLVELFPGSARIHLLAGEIAYSRKDYATAERHLSESHRLFPHWRTRRMLGKTLTQAGRLDEAEPILLELVDEHPRCRTDLAWLHERRGDFRRALEWVGTFLERFPDDRYARAQRARLEGRLMEPEEVVAEVENLIDLGETIDDDLVARYVEALLRCGRGARAREYVGGRKDSFSPRAATAAGWACYRLQAWDLALELFTLVLPANRGDVKFLSALEKAAERCGRIPEVLRLYASHAAEERRLHGRIGSLRRRLG